MENWEARSIFERGEDVLRVKKGMLTFHSAYHLSKPKLWGPHTLPLSPWKHLDIPTHLLAKAQANMN